MPFIPKKDRARIDAGESATTAGELCYLYYRDMVKAWKKSPRWTTADKIYQGILIDNEGSPRGCKSARELAWQVFFQLHVMPYELDKRSSNGDI